MAKTLAQIQAKYARGVQNGKQSMIDGINAVTVNPAQKAIEAAPLWEQRMQEAIQNQSYQKGLAKVSIDVWKRKAIEGAAKYAANATQASTAFAEFAQKAMPIWQQASAAVKQMPKGTDQDALNRVAANMQYMKQLKGMRSTR